jgi:hypothetical protein
MTDVTGLGSFLRPAGERVQAPWLEGDTPDRVRTLVERALKDVGVLETAPNRSPRIDSYLHAAGVPEEMIVAGKGWWCAAAVGAWWRECGYAVPAGYASCDKWLVWAKATKRWRATPEIGCAVLYGKGEDAHHIGLVIRVQPVILSVEGNTTVEGSAFEPNGTAVALKKVAAPDPILGYVALQGAA